MALSTVTSLADSYTSGIQLADEQTKAKKLTDDENIDDGDGERIEVSITY